jgi:hypothetical protein
MSDEHGTRNMGEKSKQENLLPAQFQSFLLEGKNEA